MKLKTSLIGVSVSFALISLLVSCGDKPVASIPPKDPDPTPVIPVVTVQGIPTAPLWWGSSASFSWSVAPGDNATVNGVLQNKVTGIWEAASLTQNTDVVIVGKNGLLTSSKTVPISVWGKDTTRLSKKDGWWKMIYAEYLNTATNTWVSAPLPSAKTTHFNPDGTCEIDGENPPIPISTGNKWSFLMVNGKLAIEWPVQSNHQYYFVDKFVTGLPSPAKDTIVTSYTVTVQGTDQFWRHTFVK